MAVTLGACVKSLAADLELGKSLPQSSEGNYELPLESDLVVTISELGNGFALKASLAPCPKNNKESLYTQALLGNLFGQGTHGAVLALSHDSSHLILIREVEELSDYKTFYETMEDFINVADYWQGIAKSYQ